MSRLIVKVEEKPVDVNISENNIRVNVEERNYKIELSNTGPQGTFDYNFSGIARVYSTNIGDGSSASVSVAHNLGTKDVLVQVYENNENSNSIQANIKRLSNDLVMLIFSSPPSSDQYRVTICG